MTGKVEHGAYANVTIQLQITVKSSWGPGTTLDQVYRQAEEDAIDVVRQHLQEKIPGVRMIGKIKVDAVISARERS